MTKTMTSADIRELPRDERLKLVEEIWNSLADEAKALPVPDWHREELDRRLTLHREAADVELWEHVKDRLLDQTKKK